MFKSYNFIITLLLIFFISNSPLYSLSQEHREELTKIKRLIQITKYRDARNELLRLLQEESKEVEIYHLLGKAYHNLGNYDFAIGSMKKAISIEPDAYYKRRLQQYKNKIEIEKKKFKLDNRFKNNLTLNSKIISHVKYGKLLEQQKKYLLAIKEYEKIKILHPERESGYFLTGRLELGLGFRNRAEENFKNLFKYNPDSTRSIDLLVSYGYSPEEISKLGYTGDFDYDSIETTGAQVQYLKGYKLFLKGKKNAEEYLDHAIQLNPDHLKAYSILSQHCFRFGDLDKSFNSSQECLRLDKKHDKARELKYHIFKRWGYENEAIKELLAGLEENTDSVQLRLLYGVELAHDKNRNKRKSSYWHLKKVIQLDPYNKVAADTLQTLGLRHNRIRKIGYKGILLPIRIDKSDIIHIPSDKKKKATPKPAVKKKAGDFKDKGRWARHKRIRLVEIKKRKERKKKRIEEREKRQAERAKKKTEEEAVKNAELELTKEIEIKVPVKSIEELIALINTMPSEEARVERFANSAKRLFPKLDDKNKNAYYRSIENEIDRVEELTGKKRLELKPVKLVKKTEEIELVNPKLNVTEEIKLVTIETDKTDEVKLPLENKNMKTEAKPVAISDTNEIEIIEDNGTDEIEIIEENQEKVIEPVETEIKKETTKSVDKNRTITIRDLLKKKSK